MRNDPPAGGNQAEPPTALIKTARGPASTHPRHKGPGLKAGIEDRAEEIHMWRDPAALAGTGSMKQA